MSGGNLYRRFEQVFAAHAERCAIRSADGSLQLTFGDLGRGASRYANALATLGVGPGDRVSVQVEKSIANVLLYLAVMKAGAVYQPLNTAYTAAEVTHFVEDAQPKLIVCDPARQVEMRTLADRCGVFAVVNLGAHGEGSLAALAASMDDRHETAERAADDLAGLLYTSGTTGRSKGAMITHGNLASNAETLVDLWRITEADTLLHALPIFHVHGLYVALNTAFLSAASMVWFDRFDAQAMIAAMPQATLMNLYGLTETSGAADDGRSDILHAPSFREELHAGGRAGHAAVHFRLSPLAGRNAPRVRSADRPRHSRALRHDRNRHDHLQPL